MLLPVVFLLNDPPKMVHRSTVEGGEPHLDYGAVRRRYKSQLPTV